MTQKNPQRRYDQALVEALASGASQVDAAQAARVSTRTVRRRQKDPAFARRVRDRRLQLVEEAGGRTAALARRAVATIEACLDCNSPAIQLRAAQLIMTLARENTGNDDDDDLESRIARLESESDGSGNER
jgi:hypothetical protein